MRANLSAGTKRIMFLVLLVIVWAAAARLMKWDEFLFPGPAAVWQRLVATVKDGSLFIALLTSMRRIVIGFGISLVGGVTLGVLTGRIELLHETFGSILLGLQALPSVCWLPLALLWFGLTEKAILFVVVMGALVSVALSTELGIRHIPPLYLRAARNLGARGWRLYRDVIIPAALPEMLSGMKLGWSFAWRSLMAGELLYVNLGLGHLLMMGRELSDMAQVVLVMLILIAIGLLFDKFLFARLERTVHERWGLHS